MASGIFGLILFTCGKRNPTRHHVKRIFKGRALSEQDYRESGEVVPGMEVRGCNAGLSDPGRITPEDRQQHKYYIRGGPRV